LSSFIKQAKKFPFLDNDYCAARDFDTMIQQLLSPSLTPTKPNQADTDQTVLQDKSSEPSPEQPPSHQLNYWNNYRICRIPLTSQQNSPKSTPTRKRRKRSQNHPISIRKGMRKNYTNVPENQRNIQNSYTK